MSSAFDMHDWLIPRLLRIVMWDQADLMRHVLGESYADYDRVLDETIYFSGADYANTP